MAVALGNGGGIPILENEPSLRGRGGGYAWPDLTFISDGAMVYGHARATSARAADPIRFLSNFNTAVPAGEFERGVDAFIDVVIERVASQAVKNRLLRDMWAEVLEERRDPALSEWRKLEAMLGFDPDEGAAELIERLLEEKETVGSNAIEEVATAAGSGALDTIVAAPWLFGFFSLHLRLSPMVLQLINFFPRLRICAAYYGRFQENSPHNHANRVFIYLRIGKEYAFTCNTKKVTFIKTIVMPSFSIGKD